MSGVDTGSAESNSVPLVTCRLWGWVHVPALSYWWTNEGPLPGKTQIAKFLGPTWGPPGSCLPQMGPMLAPRTLLSGELPGGLLSWIQSEGMATSTPGGLFPLVQNHSYNPYTHTWLLQYRGILRTHLCHSQDIMPEARSVAPRKARYLAVLRSETNRC